MLVLTTSMACILRVDRCHCELHHFFFQFQCLLRDWMWIEENVARDHKKFFLFEAIISSKWTCKACMFNQKNYVGWIVDIQWYFVNATQNNCGHLNDFSLVRDSIWTQSVDSSVPPDVDLGEAFSSFEPCKYLTVFECWCKIGSTLAIYLVSLHHQQNKLFVQMVRNLKIMCKIKPQILKANSIGAVLSFPV